MYIGKYTSRFFISLCKSINYSPFTNGDGVA